jgi:hypothetical protein
MGKIFESASLPEIYFESSSFSYKLKENSSKIEQIKKSMQYKILYSIFNN